MAEHPIAEQIIAFLNNRWSESFEHEQVRTSEDAAKIRDGYTLQQGAKAIIVRAKTSEGKKFAMLVMPADRRFDSAKAKTVLASKDLRFATEEEVEQVTGGIKPGGVPPFGNLFNLEVFADPTLFHNEKIVFNAGRTTSIAMLSSDYRELVRPVVKDIVT